MGRETFCVDSNRGSDATFVKALAYHAYDCNRTGFIRASVFLNVTLFALDSRKLR